MRITLFVMSAAVFSGVLTLIVLLFPLGLTSVQMGTALTLAHLVGIAAGFGASNIICDRLFKNSSTFNEQLTAHSHKYAV
ncbi:MAG: hypothetical protein KAQ66_04450 [Rhodospirillaceae bacterium]|nr:hypothetical protein [Rhodospirillaceae bacterium]